jgi:hypothetical protein
MDRSLALPNLSFAPGAGRFGFKKVVALIAIRWQRGEIYIRMPCGLLRKPHDKSVPGAFGAFPLTSLIEYPVHWFAVFRLGRPHCTTVAAQWLASYRHD